MSLLFFDGFDGYDSGADLTNFGGWVYNAGATVSSTVRLGSGKSLNIPWNVPMIRYACADQNGKTVYIGFAFSPISTPSASQLFHIGDASNNLQVSLYLNAGNKLEARNYSNSVLATGVSTVAVGVWYYIELKIKVASSGGIFDCKLGGVSEFTFSGNTQSQGTAAVGAIGWDNVTGVPWNYLLDDVYLCNSDGSINNTYLGEVLCKHLPLIGDTTAGFTRNTGASNYLAVDDLIGSPDDATTYVSATTTGTRDEYTLTNTSGTNAIFGVKVNTRVQKDAANPKSFKHGIKTGANQQDATVSLGIGYSNYQNIYESSDGAGTAWTSGTLDSAVSTIEVV